jgi:2-polyprenyl-6-methoxyphenol hydroxylase-like FAD-dependent oxidoreductase
MRALVCGAGIAGLTTALLLADLGWDVDLVERAPAPRQGGYMIDFFGPGYAAADAMGLLPRLRKEAYAVQEVCYVDPRGRTTVRLSYEAMRRALGGRLLSLLRGDLEAVLREELDGRAVRQRFGVTVAGLEPGPDGVVVTLSDSTSSAVDLLVGADGIHSRVRELAFGPPRRFLLPLGFHTATYAVDDAALHSRLAGRFVMTDSIDRAVGLYALRDGRVAVFAVHRTGRDEALPDDPRSRVQARYAGLGWLVPRALARCPAPPDLYYDEVAQVVMSRWVRDRVALVGDACQAVSLLAGQGASLAVAGAHVLAAEVGRGEAVPAALQRYQERLRPSVRRTQEAGRRAAEGFLPSTRRRLLMRRLVLRAMRLPGPDRLLAARLVGHAGSIP